jgi:hypothetical protein
MSPRVLQRAGGATLEEIATTEGRAKGNFFDPGFDALARPVSRFGTLPIAPALDVTPERTGVTFAGGGGNTSPRARREGWAIPSTDAKTDAASMPSTPPCTDDRA